MRRILLLVFIMIGFVPAAAAQPGDLPALADLQAGWNQIATGGETICATGTPYSFFVRPVPASDNLLIYFQGGGACWDNFTCGGAMSTYDPSVSADEVYATGIFDLDNPANPLRDYNMVFIPYCSADVFTGSRSVQYRDDLLIEHRGAVNARAVLDWVYTHFSAPQQVFVTGSSAGSLGAIFHAADIMAQYPDSRVIQLGDAYVGLIPPGATFTDTWGLPDNLSPLLRGANPPDGQIATGLYLATAAAFPQHMLAEFTSREDATQVLFYTFMGGDRADVLRDIPAALRLRADEMPNFRYFIAPGALHVILARPEFYTLSSAGLSFRDWLADLLAGNPVANVACCD